ncbi:hypothetical protein BDP27DRAFT_1334513 [Rhodocollybia butyracea]|uniref:Uncharacterized protein n=1 Tax=Rhodocollybia butyracea TaxID=206335 RepID=A0A9P5U3L5_9AGAR|nr:hypothetical protein BDP27DRAFT_1334513 [Rhodocollybia butyracea]
MSETRPQHGPDTSSAREPQPNVDAQRALPLICDLVLSWLQNFLETIALYNQIPDITVPYQSYPLPRGFPFPDTRLAHDHNRSPMFLVDLLERCPLLSSAQGNTPEAVEILANDADIVLVQSDMFQWIEEVDRHDQVYRSIRASLVIHGYLRPRWNQEGSGNRMSPLVWELRWGPTTLAALEVDSRIFDLSSHILHSLSAEFVLKTLILSLQTRHAIILTKTMDDSITFFPGRRLDGGSD